MKITCIVRVSMAFENTVFFINQPLKENSKVKEKSHGSSGGEVLAGAYKVVERLFYIMRVTG